MEVTNCIYSKVVEYLQAVKDEMIKSDFFFYDIDQETSINDTTKIDGEIKTTQLIVIKKSGQIKCKIKLSLYPYAKLQSLKFFLNTNSNTNINEKRVFICFNENLLLAGFKSFERVQTSGTLMLKLEMRSLFKANARVVTLIKTNDTIKNRINLEEILTYQCKGKELNGRALTKTILDKDINILRAAVVFLRNEIKIVDNNLYSYKTLFA